MQFHVWFGSPRNRVGKRFQQDRGDSVQRGPVHLIERDVHKASDQALDPNPSHQFTDSGVIAEGHERAKIPITP